MAVDKYANIATLEVTLSAANTLTFAEMRTGVGLDADRTRASALAIDQIDYFPSVTSFNEMTASGDNLQMAILISNASASLTNFADRRILHSAVVGRMDFGTAAGGSFYKVPLPHQFFPPLITAERSLFLGYDTIGLTNPVLLQCRIYYRQVTLTQAEFIEIAEVFRLVG